MEYPPIIDPACETVPLFEFWRPTRDWIGACLFRLVENGIPATVIRKGDDKRGTVLIVLAGAGQDCRHYTQLRAIDGHVFWVLTDRMSGPAAPRAVRHDPDLWVLEISGPEFTAVDRSEPQPPEMSAQMTHGVPLS